MKMDTEHRRASTVAETVGQMLCSLGVDRVFGVVGSGNFHVTNALIAGGARFVATRHEAGAATAADAYARISGRVAVLTVHQGCGLTNAMTGITEAAKSRTAMLVLAAEPAAAAVRSNFRIDQDALATAVGAVPERVHGATSVASDVIRAWECAVQQRRTVVLNLPLDVQAEPMTRLERTGSLAAQRYAPASDTDVGALAGLLGRAERPVFIAGRGAVRARAELEALAQACGALLATSAVAKGLFAGSVWNLDISGGFATPLAAELIGAADLVVAWGCALNMWTTRHGRLVSPGATVAQVDVESGALGAHHRVNLGVVGDVSRTATAVAAQLPGGHTGYRTQAVRQRLATAGRWRDVPYADRSDGSLIDPRTLSIALDDLLPAERIVAVDSGNFMGYPSVYLGVPDERGFCFTQAFQSIGLGLATAIGAALARPDRLPVAACGDGGFLMGIAELETVVRLGLGMLIVVYDDAAYGAEVHHFGPDGYPLSTVVFPETYIAGLARGYGCAAVTVRTRDDLAPIAEWLNGARRVPMVVDAKVVRDEPAWWLEDAFRGH